MKKKKKKKKTLKNNQEKCFRPILDIDNNDLRFAVFSWGSNNGHIFLESGAELAK